jgi:hypothetical protein
MTDTRAAFEAWAATQDLSVTGANWGVNSLKRACAWAAWQAAIKHERSECAKVCEEVGPKDGALALVTAGFAAAIRARSQP